MANKTPIVRTDIHRPSAIEPANYEFVAINIRTWGYYHDSGATALMMREQMAIKNHMTRTGGHWAGHEHGGSCYVCGAHAIYLATFYHKGTNEYIKTGFDCADKMQMGDANRFRVLRKAIDAAQGARSGWKKAEGYLITHDLTEAWDIFVATNKPDKRTLEGALRMAGLEGDDLARLALRDLWMEEGLDPDAQPVSWGYEERTIADIIGKLAKYGSISPGQVNYLRVLVGKIATRPQENARKAEIAAARAEEKALADDVPTGKQSALVKVLKIEEREYGSGYYATTRTVMTVKAVVGGWVAWGTLPTSCSDAKVGDTIDLKATFERSDRDCKFGFFKRPSGKLIPAEQPESAAS